MLIRSPYLPPLILSEYSNFDSRMETGEFNSHHLLQDFVKWESLVHVSYIMNHFRKKNIPFWSFSQSYLIIDQFLFSLILLNTFDHKKP